VPSDTVVCAYEVAPGKACGLPLLSPTSTPIRFGWRHEDTSPDYKHRAIPGRQCQTCGGSGRSKRPVCTVPAAKTHLPRCYECPRCIGGVERIVAVTGGE